MAKRRLGEELGEWIASLRFSGYTVLIVALVIIGGLVVSPTLTTYVNQQRELAELRESVRLQQQAVNDADEARERWLDPSYVRSQARARLFYVMPGEMQLSVIEDVVIPADNTERTSDTLTAAEGNWARSLAASVLAAGKTTVEPQTNGVAATPLVIENLPAAEAPPDGGEGADEAEPDDADAGDGPVTEQEDATAEEQQ